MGGVGSGSFERARRLTVEELPCLTLQDVKNGYWLSNFSLKVEHGRVELAHCGGGFRGSVPLVKTHQKFGGHRVWFQCPFCEHRRTKLYFYDRCLSCRVCIGLAYKSSQMSDFNRRVQQIAKGFNQLELDAGNPFFSPYERPKGMHRKAYQKLARRLESNRKKAFGGLEVAAESLAKGIGSEG